MDRIGERDRNTSFFHKSVLIKRNTSRINSLKNNIREVITDQEGIHNLILSFYKNLYSMEKTRSQRHPVIPVAIKESVGHEPTLDEIRIALFSMKPLKAPGPDGFHPIFF